MEIDLVGSELFYADGRTDDSHDGDNSRFSQLCDRT